MSQVPSEHEILSLLHPRFPLAHSNPRFESMKERLDKAELEASKEQWLDLLNRELPSKDDQLAYHEWVAILLREYTEKGDDTTPQSTIDAQSWINHLNTIDYTDIHTLVHLNLLFRLDYGPAIIVGWSRGVLYEVLLSQSELQPRKPSPDSEKRDVMFSSLLGVNANGDEPFSILHQIGSLRAYDGEYKNLEDAAADSEH
ncbi:MAG: hypothetical protein Q9170_001797 [Blastenia crenularia]